MSRILIVEDEPRIVAFLTKGLKAAGFTTHTTAEGGQAVALAVQEDFDLIILDVGLPDIDGFEVLQQLRGQGVGTPVIMLTARVDEVDRLVGKPELGADKGVEPLVAERGGGDLDQPRAIAASVAAHGALGGGAHVKNHSHNRSEAFAFR